MKNLFDKLFFLKDQEGENNSSGPSWKYRRKLIYGGYRLGFFMVIFGAFTFLWDREVSAQLVIGGVALISIILTAYTASATVVDVKRWDNKNEDEGEL
jgi:polyferredoxin